MASRNLELMFTDGFKEAREAGRRPCFGWYEPRYLAGQVSTQRGPSHGSRRPDPNTRNEEADDDDDVNAQMSRTVAAPELQDVLFPSTLTSSCFFPSPAALVEAGILGSRGVSIDSRLAAPASHVTSEEESLRMRAAGQNARVLFQWSKPSSAEALFESGGLTATLADSDAISQKVPPARDYERLLLDQ